MAEPMTSLQAVQSDQAQAAVADLAGLVREHHADVYRYACRLAGCSSEAEDLTQQTFLIVHQRLQQLRDPARARNWLLAIVRRCFLKSVRRTRPTAAQDLNLNVEHVADRAPSISQIDREELHHALCELPDDFRIVLLMFYFEELSYQEIAFELNLPLGTVMSRLSRAKGHLRKKLTPPDRPLRRRSPAAGAPTGVVRFTSPSPVRAAH